MATAEVIDLTLSSPRSINIVEDVEEASYPLNTVETQDETKKKRRSRGKRNAGHDSLKKEDKNNNGDLNGKPKLNCSVSKNKREREEDNGSTESNKRRRSSSSPLPFFTLDANPSVTDLTGFVSTQTDIPSPPLFTKPGFHTINGLLLPSHITIVTDDPSIHMENSDTRPLSPDSDATGIDFLDDDRAAGAPRYFEDVDSLAKAIRTCKKCGVEGHDIRECTTQICLTCGARNEHGTRSCPVLRVCFTCQGKGHLARDCPRIGSTDRQGRSRQDCDRCGSYKHHGSNCPTLWRIYSYVTEMERDTILADREAKRGLIFENGGQGYIARDHWCYNCSQSGHLGDDCTVAGNADKPDEHSAFGKFNWLTGPFASVTSSAPHVERAPPLWESGDRLDDRRGFSIEGDVGRKGREKARQRAAEAQKRLDDEDDEPDWFSRNRNGPANNSPKSRSSDPSKHSQPTFRFGFNESFSFKGTDNTGGRSRISLLDRIDMGDDLRSDLSSRRAVTTSSRDKKRDWDEKKHRDNRRDRDDWRKDDRGYYKREWDRDRDRDRDRAGRDRGSRWRGGYDHPW